MIDIEQEKWIVNRLANQLDHLEKTIEEEKEKLEQAEMTLKRSLHAQEILQLISQAIQEKVHLQISEVVSSCLSSVFDDPYTFKIEFERKRGRTEAVLKFSRREMEADPLSATGGGAVDVAAFALRVASLALHRPKLSKIVVLDEAFRFVSVEYQDNIRTMLEQLATDLSLQIILVTHNERLATGKVIEL